MYRHFNAQQFGARVKLLRKNKSLSIIELADTAGVNKNTICSIEGGKHNTSIGVAFKIADALDVDPAMLMSPKPLHNLDYLHTERVQKGARRARRNIEESLTHRIGDTDVHLKGGNILAGIVEVFSEGKKEMHNHDGEELFFCLTGRIMVDINGEKVFLKKGDCVLFWGTMPHSYTSDPHDNSGKVSVGLSVISGSSFDSLTALYNAMETVES